jgi:hypothetical protein
LALSIIGGVGCSIVIGSEIGEVYPDILAKKIDIGVLIENEFYW